MQGGLINGVHVDAMTFVMHALTEKYSELPEEQRLAAMTALMTFHRNQGESTDDLITRFEDVVAQANEFGQMTLTTTRAGPCDLHSGRSAHLPHR